MLKSASPSPTPSPELDVEVVSESSSLGDLVDTINGFLWATKGPLVFLLLSAGLFVTFRTGFIQFRHFPKMFAALKGSRTTSDKNSISSFEAFATSLAARVGTGNIAGVAVAITLGGPGAVFWMWVIALIGMATSMAEATLAQIYKHRDKEGLFRGGPAYYMERGLGARWMGVLFSVMLLISYGVIFGMVQSNAISEAVGSAFSGVPKWVVSAVLAVLTMLVIMGGLRRVSRTAELIVPFMAVAYVGMVLFVALTNLGEIPGTIVEIVKAAFAPQPAVGGFTGYAVAAALQNGIRRGLFSNEAGLGSAPNAAATADVAHPVRQGYVQSLGVFFDTIVICTATALLILLADVYKPGQTGASGVSLTQASLAAEVGSWGNQFVAIALMFFAFSTIIANYSFGETNLHYIFHNKQVQKIAILILKIVTVVMVVVGVYQPLEVVFGLADVALGAMAMVNLAAVLLLSNVAVRVIKDYATKVKTDPNPVFDPTGDERLMAQIEPGIWPPTGSSVGSSAAQQG